MPHIGELWPPQAIKVPMIPVVLGASPSTFTAPRDGMLVVSGGSPSLIEYRREGVSVGLGVTAGAIPVRAGDELRITYVLPPTATFL